MNIDNPDSYLSFGVKVNKIVDFTKFYIRVEDCIRNARTKDAIIKLHRASLLAHGYDCLEKNFTTIN